jgi:hypothetical protein
MRLLTILPSAGSMLGITPDERSVMLAETTYPEALQIHVPHRVSELM